MDSLINFLCNQQFLVYSEWGYNLLNQILLNSAIAKNENHIKEQFEKSLQVDYYNENGYVGNTYDELDIREGTIAKVSLQGLMTSNDGLCHQGARGLSNELYSLYKNSKISGIIIDAETGGGQSVAGDILYNAIKDKNKPVGIHTTLLASAGIKATLPADFIMAASESTIVGSIGTMIVLNKKDLERSKEDYIELYSKKSPNKNLSYREVKLGNYEELIAELTTIDEVFMNLVSKHRPLRGNVERTLSGAVFTAQEGIELGLVDSVGTLSDAINNIYNNLKFY
jgi:protease-4